MQITRYTDYSLRVLIYLAIHPDQLCTIQNIADSYGISKNHLMKIVQELNLKGYVTAVRGKNGGVTLNKMPNEINVGTLVRIMEHDSKLLECFSENNHCVISPSCRLKGAFVQALESFYGCLDAYHLSDFLNEDINQSLQALLVRS